MTIKKSEVYDCIVVGGGFYGCEIALFLKKYFKNIIILESGNALLKRASYVNQARVHNGYHYPRSFPTALRSHINFDRFCRKYKYSIDSKFRKIYAIARKNSKVNASSFYKFCKLVNIPIKEISIKTNPYFNADLIETIFEVNEVAFDAKKIADNAKALLDRNKIPIIFNVSVKKIGRKGNVNFCHLDDGTVLKSKKIFVCIYSQINTLLYNSDLQLLPFKHEVTEIALVKTPKELEKLGITVMDGPFFSIMPFPAEKLHSFSHVRYTPHEEWFDKDKFRNPYKYLEGINITSSYPFMQKDAKRYIPIMDNLEYRRSIYEIKTLLADHEIDDGRPILYRKDYDGIENLFIIMGGKIDNIFDIISVLKKDIIRD